MISDRFVNAVLATGVPEVDSDHRDLLSDARLLERAFLTGASLETLQAMTRRFATRIETHFREEEALAESGRFVVSEAHRRDHQRIQRELRNLMEVFRLAHTQVSAHDLFRAEDHLINHIIRYDQEIRHAEAAAAA